jgi:Uma2 family endonuclease
MDTTTTEPLLTADEFLRHHGGETCVELVRGQVVRYPMPGGPHGLVAGNATALLHNFVREHGLGRVFSNDTFTRTRIREATARLRGPDVAFVRFARLPKGPVPEGPLPVAPDLVIEVRSPSERIPQLTSKATEYLDAGVTAVLVLDPDTESVALFRENELPIRMHNGDELTLPDRLPDFAVPVKKYFD